MDRTMQGCVPASQDPLPFVRGLFQLIPEQRLAAILTRTARTSERRRRLPADSVIWLVIAMALFAADCIPKVWRRLHPTRDEPEPTDSAFAQARQRLGVAALRQLFLETARPIATHQTVGAFYRGWRLMGLDGSTLDLPDTPANAQTFGRPTTGRAQGAFPQVRLLALCELGTHAVCGLVIKPLCHGEPSMVAPLLDQLGPGTLLIWDRGFFSYELIAAVVRRECTCWHGSRVTPYSDRSGASTTARTWPRSTRARPTAAGTRVGCWCESSSTPTTTPTVPAPVSGIGSSPT